MKLPSLRALRVWRRNVIVWRHGAMWSNLFGDLAEPILYLFGLGYGLGHFVEGIGQGDYLAFVAPGLLAMGAVWSSSFENTYGAFTRMEQQKTYQAIMATPIDIEDVVVGDVAWGATKAVLGAAMVLAVAFAIGVARTPLAVACLVPAFLVGWVFAAIAMTATSLARGYDFFTYYFTLFLTPVQLLSEAWYPLDGFPALVRWLAELSPMTHAVRASRALMAGTVDGSMWVNAGVLLLYGAAFTAAAMALVRRRMVQ